MKKKNKHPSEANNTIPASYTENSDEYLKYVKKLELQRTVLKMIVNSDITQIASDNPSSNDNPDSN